MPPRLTPHPTPPPPTPTTTTPTTTTLATPTPGRRHPRRRALVVATALVAVMALLGAGCKQLDENNRALPVFGATNGNLRPGFLVEVAPGCRVYWEAANSMRTMIADARAQGISLVTTSCYRDYAGQVAARDWWCGQGSCHMAAVPGTSNHGWGKAVDWRPAGGTMTYDHPAYLWMLEKAGSYGWMQPKAMRQGGSVPEPWHWEWVGDGGSMFPGEYFGIGNALPLKGSPIGNVDAVITGPGEVQVLGWALDPDQQDSIDVHVYVDGGWGGAHLADAPRPDVGAAYPAYASRPHGFDLRLGVASGTRTVCVYGIEKAGTGSNVALGCRTVTVPTPAAPANLAPLGSPAPDAPLTGGVTTTTTSSSVPTPTSTGSTTTSTSRPPVPTTASGRTTAAAG